MVGLGDLSVGRFNSIAFDVTDDGSVVVGGGTTASGTTAFIWDAINGMRNLEEVLINDFVLDLAGWRLISGRGVSSDGLVVTGFGLNPDGVEEAWIANMRTDPVPEPSTLTIFATGLVGLGFMMRRRRRT